MATQNTGCDENYLYLFSALERQTWPQRKAESSSSEGESNEASQDSSSGSSSDDQTPKKTSRRRLSAGDRIKKMKFSKPPERKKRMRLSKVQNF
jgi:hypothetical protein